MENKKLKNDISKFEMQKFEDENSESLAESVELEFCKKEGREFDPNYVISAMKLFNLEKMLFDKKYK